MNILVKCMAGNKGKGLDALVEIQTVLLISCFIWEKMTFVS